MYTEHVLQHTCSFYIFVVLTRAQRHCNTLQHAASLCNTNCNTHYNSHCNTPAASQCCGLDTRISTLQHTATRCNTLQHTATHSATHPTTHTATHTAHTPAVSDCCGLDPQTITQQHTATHTATHCNTHCTTHCNTPTISDCCGLDTHTSALQHTATYCTTHCTTLQHALQHTCRFRFLWPWHAHQCTATHCNTLQPTLQHTLQHALQHTCRFRFLWPWHAHQCSAVHPMSSCVTHIQTSQVTHVNKYCHTCELCHIWVSTTRCTPAQRHAPLHRPVWHTYKQVKSHMWTSTVTCACTVTHMRQYHVLHTSTAPCTPISSCVTHIQTSIVTHCTSTVTPAYCHTHASVPHVAHQRSAVHPHVVLRDTHMKKSCHTCGPVLSFIGTVTHVSHYHILHTSAAPRTPISSCVTQTWMSQVTHVNDSSSPHESGVLFMTHIQTETWQWYIVRGDYSCDVSYEGVMSHMKSNYGLFNRDMTMIYSSWRLLLRRPIWRSQVSYKQ